MRLPARTAIVLLLACAAAAVACTRERVVVREVPAACPACPVCPIPAETAGVKAASDSLTAEDGPAVSVLYHLTDQYQPVRFDHAGHVGYSDRCTDCHHHSNDVERFPPCRECHGRSQATLARPGLKGAYHRQCMNCHREAGSGPLGCNECHEPRQKRPDPEEMRDLTRQNAPKKAILGHLADQYQPAVFDHELHVEVADRCEDCHHHHGEVEQAPPCRECHRATPSPTEPRRLALKDAYHGQCLACHKEMDGPHACTDCHPAKKEPPAGR